MLKIKDNIDLKELEKFGFEIKNSYNEKFYGTKIGYYFYQRDINHYFEIEINPRKEITININCERSLDGYTFELLDVQYLLYDLIKADLVEKSE